MLNHPTVQMAGHLSTATRIVVVQDSAFDGLSRSAAWRFPQICHKDHKITTWFLHELTSNQPAQSSVMGSWTDNGVPREPHRYPRHRVKVGATKIAARLKSVRFTTGPQYLRNAAS